MAHPIVADNKPCKVSLRKGQQYYFCACGRSKNQPFCDGSHAGTPFTPLAFTAEQNKEAYLCACKHTKNPPYCDGTHKKFSNEDVGKEFAGDDEKTEEPFLAFIHQLADNGLATFGQEGPMTSMGVPRYKLQNWDDIQIITAQLSTQPLLDDVPVNTELIIGPQANKPLRLNIPLFVSDMSFGSLSEEAKIALAKGAELCKTGICSGEGGILPEEKEQNSRYFYEYASGEFGYNESILKDIQAFHFKAGQAAKTGIGGHLPGNKNVGKVAKVRATTEGTDVISPATFTKLHTSEDFKKFANRVRELSGGIPIGFKMSANHIEEDIQFALDASADYIILDGRGGGTGAAPEIFRDNISVSTIAALARARKYLDKVGASGRVTLIITGGLRTPADFVKAMALGAEGIALASSALQAIGCRGTRICHTNNCPAGITTQKPELRAKLNVEKSAQHLANFFEASSTLMQGLARACGHNSLSQFNKNDIATAIKDMASLSGINYVGV